MPLAPTAGYAQMASLVCAWLSLTEEEEEEAGAGAAEAPPGGGGSHAAPPGSKKQRLDEAYYLRVRAGRSSLF